MPAASASSDPFFIEETVENVSAIHVGALSQLVDMLEVELDDNEKHILEKSDTSNPVAHEYYLMARGHLQGLEYLQLQTKLDAVATAIEFYRQALAEDPGYALAHAGVGRGVLAALRHEQ